MLGTHGRGDIVYPPEFPAFRLIQNVSNARVVAVHVPRLEHELFVFCDIEKLFVSVKIRAGGFVHVNVQSALGADRRRIHVISSAPVAKSSSRENRVISS